MHKTVYVLGAGFSMDAGGPSQNDLVKNIFETYKNHPDKFKNGSIQAFKKFLRNTMAIPTRLQNKVPLEDIFTPLDRCLADNISFRNLGIEEIKKIRELVYYLISKSLQLLLETSSKDYINQFAEFLVSQCSQRKEGKYPNFDPVSVLSLNWDILLDKSIKGILSKPQYQKGAGGVVDYCCHISSYDENDHSIKPGLEVLGKGGFNVKLIKLHGSLNWLQCSRCLRLYVDFNDKIALLPYENDLRCRHCDKNFSAEASNRLSSNLIMPTFLKDFSDPQYKIIWQNAAIELSEANKVVFIGYSLPQADFEMRQLLSRMIKTDAKIEVIEYGKKTEQKIKETKDRFTVFFGKREPKFYLKGAKQFIIDGLHESGIN